MRFLLGKAVFLLLSILFSFQFVFADEVKEVRIAALLPLTGPVANAGVDIKRGMELAIEQLKSGTVRPVLIFEDTQYDLRQTATAARKVIEQDKADVVVSLWDGADVVAPITEKAGKLHISIRWDPLVTKGRPLTFTLEATYQTWVRDYLELLRQQKVKSITIVSLESASGLQVVNEIKNKAESYGIKILAEDLFPDSTGDFRSVLTKSLAKKPEVMFFFAFPPNNQVLVKQLRQLSPTQRFSGMLELMDDLTLLEGVATIAPFGSSPAFNELFQSRYKDNYKIRAPHGYELVRLVTDIYSELWLTQKPTPVQAAEKLMQIRERPSSLGPLTVGKNRNIEHPTAKRIVENGKWRDFE